MGDSFGNPSGHAFPRGGAEPDSLRGLAACTCLLAAVAVATFPAFSFIHRDEATRIAQASKLAQEGLEKAISAHGIPGAGNSVSTARELIVCQEDGESYWRRIEIDPGSRARGPARFTVTVAWKTIAGEAHVQMHGRLEAKETEQVSPVFMSEEAMLRGALSP